MQRKVTRPSMPTRHTLIDANSPMWKMRRCKESILRRETNHYPKIAWWRQMCLNEYPESSSPKKIHLYFFFSSVLQKIQFGSLWNGLKDDQEDSNYCPSSVVTLHSNLPHRGLFIFQDGSKKFNETFSFKNFFLSTWKECINMQGVQNVTP